MQSKKIAITSLIIVLILAGSLLAIRGVFHRKSLEKNIGVTHMTISTNENGVTTTSPDIDSVVPQRDKLIKNLTGKGYSITYYDKIDELGISVNGIHAKKGKSFIDICYGLSSTDVKNVFGYFEDTYNTYYILAQNENYVYCISDKSTFKRAGFKSLANNGMQYIYD